VRRAWLPNVHLKRLWSDILARNIRINVTPYTLRQVDRMGGECGRRERVRRGARCERGVNIDLTTRTHPFFLPLIPSLAGVDNYLLYSPPAALHSRTGLVLRQLLTETLEFKGRVAAKYGAAAANGAAPPSASAAAEAAAAAARQQDAISATLAEIEAAAEPLVSDGDLAAASATSAAAGARSSSNKELR
jgi:ribosomal protein L28